MTDAKTAEDFEYTKGDLVRYTGPEDLYWNYEYNTLYEDEPYEVTRVYKNRIEIKGRVATRRYSGYTPLSHDSYKVSVLKAHVAPFVGPAPRKLGEVPEGDFIAPTDPRIAWFFDDAAKMAKKEGYCKMYDRITDQLGAPGRERSFKVSTKVNGLSVNTSIRARSRSEAEAKVAEALGVTEVTGTEED